jgi:hypothetical protein
MIQGVLLAVRLVPALRVPPGERTLIHTDPARASPCVIRIAVQQETNRSAHVVPGGSGL